MTDPKKPEVLKPFTLTTIGTVAAVLAFSTGCIHFNPGVVAEAKKSQEVSQADKEFFEKRKTKSEDDQEG